MFSLATTTSVATAVFLFTHLVNGRSFLVETSAINHASAATTILDHNTTALSKDQTYSAPETTHPLRGDTVAEEKVLQSSGYLDEDGDGELPADVADFFQAGDDASGAFPRADSVEVSNNHDSVSSTLVDGGGEYINNEGGNVFGTGGRASNSRLRRRHRRRRRRMAALATLGVASVRATVNDRSMETRPLRLPQQQHLASPRFPSGASAGGAHELERIRANDASWLNAAGGAWGWKVGGSGAEKTIYGTVSAPGNSTSGRCFEDLDGVERCQANIFLLGVSKCGENLTTWKQKKREN